MEEIKAALTKFEATLAMLLGQMVDVREDVKKVSDKVSEPRGGSRKG